MKMQWAEYTVEELINLYNNKMLTVNAEYQRGVVWNDTQRKKLIDSVLRGYPLPVIYLHYIKKEVAGMLREDFEIVDGQQRINALHGFFEGAFKLFHPVEDDSVAHFPRFLHSQPCPWAKSTFSALPDEWKTTFLQTKIPVAKIETDVSHEIRDLFVRLQAGFPLNAQEKRDSFPGDFTDFILQIGGKPDIARYPGHPFFQRILRMKPGQDRGKTRQLAAQIAMLFLAQRSKNASGEFTSINSSAIDEFYYTNIDFDSSSDDAKRLREILDKLDTLFGDGKRPKLRAHDAIHLVLLTDLLWDDYTRSWQASLPKAYDAFASTLAKATASRYEPQPDEAWLRYGQWTRVNSDNATSIRARHEFYTEQMLALMNSIASLTLKDPNRLFGQLEREIIYYRDQKRCWVCQAEVAWDDAEFHHLQEHNQGGQTTVENGVLVHRHCHPRGVSTSTVGGE